MQLMEKLQDYTRAEFITLVDRIWSLEGAEQQTLVKHFISIVNIADSERLLFDPPLDMTFGDSLTAGAVAAYVQRRHHQAGKTAFSDDTLPALIPGVRPSLEQAALKRSMVNKASAELLITRISSAGNVLERALKDFNERLELFMDGQSDDLQLASYLNVVTALEISQEAVDKAMNRFEFLEQRLELSWSGAQRDVSTPSLNAKIQGEILNALSRVRDDYPVLLSTTRQRRLELHLHSLTVFSAVEKQLALLRSAVGHSRIRTFEAALAEAHQVPCLLLSEWPTSVLSGHFSDVQRSLRSAVAALTADAGASPSGSYAGVLSFYFNNLSDEQDFGLSLPLAEITRLEGIDWYGMAATLGQAELSLRLCCGTSRVPEGTLKRGLRDITSLIEVRLTSSVAGSGVRVRPALRDEDGQGFSFTDSGITLSWRQGNPASGSAASGKPPKVGAFQAPQMPRLEHFETLQDVHFNDFIVVFPPDSGRSPLYVMFMDRAY